jgi:REP element-mobilizing transposase RayT
MHCTFSTKDRYPFIDSDLDSRLWPYLGGIARENRMKALAIGGIADHAHALLSLPGTMSFAKAVQLIKGGSSKWVHDTFPQLNKFAWQEGYGAFSVSASQVPNTIAYINNQKAEEDLPGRVSGPAQQAWHRVLGIKSYPRSEPVKRATGIHRCLGFDFNRPFHGLRPLIFARDPTDESMGYYHSSAARTWISGRVSSLWFIQQAKVRTAARMGCAF